MQHILATELATELAAQLSETSKKSIFLLDVREPWEYEKCHIAGSVLMPMQTVPERLQELDDEAEIVCICHHGSRSMQVALFLERNGFTNVVNLTGGVHVWSLQVDSTMPQY